MPIVTDASVHTVHCDIFCAVVDNFGDIGVCWRLARQLRREAGWRIRLWVDDLPVFARLCPAVDAAAPTQTVDAVQIAHWIRTPGHPQAPGCQDAQADVVIEAFGCELPEDYIAGLALRPRPPVWINLEYLSAETWVADFHLQPSPHPRYPGLSKTFFFPGLRPGSGGVLLERDLRADRRAFLSAGPTLGPPAAQAEQATPRVTRATASEDTSHPTDPCLSSGAAPNQTRLWQALGIAPPAPEATKISLFGYENPSLPALLDAWRAHHHPIVCIVPESRISPGIAHYLGRDTFTAGAVARSGALTLHGVGFMDSALYDRLLWTCDLNFVRGEDSFVRALWAERPMVWQLYPQADDAHLVKLAAALEASPTMPAAMSAAPPDTAAASVAQTARNAFWQAWNTGAAPPWAAFWRHRDRLTAQAAQWASAVAALGGLAANLAEFAENRLK